MNPYTNGTVGKDVKGSGRVLLSDPNQRANRDEENITLNSTPT